MNIEYTKHPDYTKAEDELFLIRKFIEGAAAVKREGVKFLPHPNLRFVAA